MKTNDEIIEEIADQINANGYKAILQLVTNYVYWTGPSAAADEYMIEIDGDED